LNVRYYAKLLNVRYYTKLLIYDLDVLIRLK